MPRRKQTAVRTNRNDSKDLLLLLAYATKLQETQQNIDEVCTFMQHTVVRVEALANVLGKRWFHNNCNSCMRGHNMAELSAVHSSLGAILAMPLMKTSQATHLTDQLTRKWRQRPATINLIFFFSSSLAVNALWHGPDNDISGEKGGTQRNWPVPVKMANHHTKPQQHKPRRPANPPARLAFRLQSNKATSKRGQAQQKTPTNDLP